MCTQQALRITSGIHETDTKNKKKKADLTSSTQQPQINTNIKISDERVHHAGRLLLNNGYLSDAIKTRNSVYLNDDIVKKVINHMWYKQEDPTIRKV
jgi:hypothetical protein